MKKVVKVTVHFEDGSVQVLGGDVFTLPDNPWAPKNSCPKCGIKLDGAMGYVCNNHPCPTGLGGSWCSNNE